MAGRTGRAGRLSVPRVSARLPSVSVRREEDTYIGWDSLTCLLDGLLTTTTYYWEMGLCTASEQKRRCDTLIAGWWSPPVIRPGDYQILGNTLSRPVLYQSGVAQIG